MAFSESATLTALSAFEPSSASCFWAPSSVRPCFFTRYWMRLRASISSAVYWRFPFAVRLGWSCLGKEFVQKRMQEMLSPSAWATSLIE